MSNTPGPVARPSATVNGRAASVPRGNTVSWWPSTSTRGGDDARRCTCGPAGPSITSGVRPKRRSISSATAAAERVSAVMSRDGDSTSTNACRSASISVRSKAATHPR